MYKQFSLLTRSILWNNNTVCAAVASTADFPHDSLSSLLKYLVYGAYMLEHEGCTPDMLAKFKKWGEEAKPVLNWLKINPKMLDKMTNSIPTGKWTVSKLEKLHEDAYAFRNPIHEKKAKVKGIRGVPPRYSTLLNYLDTYYNSGSENSYKNIENYVKELKEPSLTRLLVHTVNEAANPQHIHDYLAFVRKHMKDPKALEIPAAEKKGLKEADAEKLKLLSKNYREAKRAIRRSILRGSGSDLIPVNDYRSHVKGMGLEERSIPEGFDGKIDEDGKYYTKDGHAIQGLPVGGKVRMNKDWHHKNNPSVWVARGQGVHQKDEALYYSVDHVDNHREGKKSDSVNVLTEKLPEMQKQWRKDMKAKDSLDKMLAMMVECLYLTAARIGTNEKAETSGNRTYGLCTWLVKHVRPQANGTVKLVYRPGKSKESKIHETPANMDITHVLRPADPESTALIQYLTKLVKGKKPSDPLWEYNGKRVTSNMVNAYLKELSGGMVSPKNFRTFRGTKLFIQLLEQRPPKKNCTEKELKAYHNMQATKVGELLGHVKTNADGARETKGTTAMRSYIDPTVQQEMYYSRGYQPPSSIIKLKSA